MSPSTTKSPTTKQLAFLKALADRTATTFTYPRTSVEASREINRLRKLAPLTADERSIARRALDGDRETLTPASAVRADEIVGYGSSATWR